MSEAAVVATARIAINAPPQAAFERAVSIAPDALIKARGPMPGVAAWRGAPRWSATGDARQLTMTAGATLTETLTDVDPPHMFAYRSVGFEGWFGALNDHCETRWTFSEAGAGATRIDWRVAFFPTGGAARFLLPLVVKPLWPGYMRAALERLRDA